MIYTLKRKVKSLSKFKEFKAFPTDQTKEKIKKSKEQQCKQIYVKRFSRILYNADNSSPNICIIHVANGVAKWMNCTIMEAEQCMF